MANPVLCDPIPVTPLISCHSPQSMFHSNHTWWSLTSCLSQYLCSHFKYYLLREAFPYTISRLKKIFPLCTNISCIIVIITMYCLLFGLSLKFKLPEICIKKKIPVPVLNYSIWYIVYIWEKQNQIINSLKNTEWKKYSIFFKTGSFFLLGRSDFLAQQMRLKGFQVKKKFLPWLQIHKIYTMTGLHQFTSKTKVWQPSHLLISIKTLNDADTG